MSDLMDDGTPYYQEPWMRVKIGPQCERREPTSPSVVTDYCGGHCGYCDETHGDWERVIERHEADAQRLATENRELKEEIKRMRFVGGIHGS